MSSESSKVVWNPPPRPDWVEKINAAGRALDIRSIVPLHPDELVNKAIENTGLSDFGVDDWREPFQILVNGVEQDADLNLMGRIMTRSDILRTLEARLRIEDTYKKHPEINEQVIKAPLLITGAARTGTSALLNLFAADPENQAPRCWESWFPCPPPEDATYDTEPRTELADKRALMWSDVVPGWDTLYELRGYLPIEDNFLHELSFRSRVIIWHGKNPSYLQWISTADLKPAHDYMVRVLKLLQWKHKRKRWVLKTPALAVPLELHFETFPDAQLIYTHRDPVMSLQSGINLVHATYWVRSDNYKAHQALCDAVTNEEAIAAATNHNARLTQSGAIPKEQVFHLLYEDFIKDSVYTVERIYKYFGIEFSDSSRDAVKKYVAENTKARKAAAPQRFNNTTPFTPEQIARIRILFKDYQEMFGIRNDV